MACSGSAGQPVGGQCAQQPAAVGNAQRAVGGGSASLPAEPRDEHTGKCCRRDVTVPAVST
eukprot:1816273-Prymnesium_polylepis.1